MDFSSSSYSSLPFLSSFSLHFVEGQASPPTMTQLGHALARLDVRWSRRITRIFRALWDRLLACSVPHRHDRQHGAVRHRRLRSCFLPSPRRHHHLSPSGEEVEDCSSSPSGGPAATDVGPPTDPEVDLDLVALKISLLGDCHVGKTSFMNKYVGNMEEQRGLQLTGLNLMDKVLFVRGVRIAFSIWDVNGDHQFLGHVPIACKDSVAILIMFDLTNRCTLNNAISWFRRARKWNKTAFPILIGTKFDDFAQLPLDMQWAIVNEARACTRAMKATLFFSSATHNINVNKIFKFIIAKLFNLPWTVERNLTVGEPIIDF